MYFRKQITALGGGCGCMKYVRGPRPPAAAGCQPGSGAGAGRQEGLGKGKGKGKGGGGGAFSSLTGGRDRPPYAAGPFPWLP